MLLREMVVWAAHAGAIGLEAIFTRKDASFSGASGARVKSVLRLSRFALLCWARQSDRGCPHPVGSACVRRCNCSRTPEAFVAGGEARIAVMPRVAHACGTGVLRQPGNRRPTVDRRTRAAGENTVRAAHVVANSQKPVHANILARVSRHATALVLLVAVRVADGQAQRAILSNAGATFEAAVCTADMFRLGTNVAVVALEDAALAEYACARIQVRAIGVDDGRPGQAFVREAATVAVAVVSFLTLAALKAADGVDARLVRVARVRHS